MLKTVKRPLMRGQVTGIYNIYVNPFLYPLNCARSSLHRHLMTRRSCLFRSFGDNGPARHVRLCLDNRHVLCVVERYNNNRYQSTIFYHTSTMRIT